ncbi:Rha family transcriptional regulator [Weissella koreensis]|uniref:Rha family transcriptional regulator n=1 Tax=Weissella koreensis TaxID=165096 RepID=UPI0013052ED9|nr:Rha family transcriptional regulator [Weissella koreensis]
MYSNPTDGIYTTPEIIAEYTNIQVESINRLIRNHKSKLEAFGVMRFEIRKPLKGSKGGRPTKHYFLNEPQATLLITFLDNTDTVATFKENLVHAFYEQREELTNARIMLERNHKTNKDLGETIKNCLPDNPHAFSNYHTLAYMVVTGLTPKQFREARNVTDAQDGLTANELKQMELIRSTMAGLIELGKSYQEIKEIVQ